jgi:hypothetical protein
LFEEPPAPPDLTDQLDEPFATTAPPTTPTTPTIPTIPTTTAATTAPSTQPVAAVASAATAPAPPAADAPVEDAPVEDAPVEDAPVEDAEQARAWKHVQNLYYDADPAKPLLAIETFERDYPGARAAELQKYRDDLFDKLWWMRIDGLFDQRKSLTAAIVETQAQIGKESEDAYRKTVLEPKLANQKAKLAAVGERLAKDMNYRAPDPPPISKAPEMAKLRSQRVASVYENWKKGVMKSLRESHGQLPWANER